MPLPTDDTVQCPACHGQAPDFRCSYCDGVGGVSEDRFHAYHDFAMGRMKRPDGVYSQFHLDNWTDADFAKHAAATRKTLTWLLTLEAAMKGGK